MDYVIHAIQATKVCKIDCLELLFANESNYTETADSLIVQQTFPIPHSCIFGAVYALTKSFFILEQIIDIEN